MHLIAFQDIQNAQSFLLRDYIAAFAKPIISAYDCTYRCVTDWFIENVSKAGTNPWFFDANPECIVLTLCQAGDAVHFFF